MRRLAVAVLTAALSAGLAAPALGAQPLVPRVVQFSHVIATGGSGAGAWRSPVLRAPKRFDLVGLRWRGQHELGARIRVRDAASGRWSRWTPMASDHAGGAGAEPVWAGGADAYELRLDRRPRHLVARFVNATGSATAAERLTTVRRRAARAGGTTARAVVPTRADGGSTRAALPTRADGGSERAALPTRAGSGSERTALPTLAGSGSERAALPTLAGSGSERAAFSTLAGGGGQTRAQDTGVGAGGLPAAIIPREAWAGDQCPPRRAPGYGEVQVGFVHHTVNANDYSPQDSAAVVLAICRYHRDVNGWNDVGYNFLVDRYGQVFEGRAGGIDQPVVGAQAQGYNASSTGVANLGTFSAEPQTAAGLHATAQLLAWKLSLHGVPVSGQVTVRSGGGPTNRYRVGAPVTFERIAAHGDADKTECPGGALLAQLPEIRAQAAALAPTFVPVPASAITIAAPDQALDFPQAAQLSGHATAAGGAPLAGAPVSLQMASGEGFVTVARTSTGADGAWSTMLATQYSRTLRAVARLPEGGVVTSQRIEVEVAPRIALRATSRVTARRAFTISGSMRPRRGRLELQIARAGSDRALHRVARFAVPVRGGRFTVKVALRRPALHRLRIVFAGDARNSGGRSADVYVRAVRPAARG